MAQHIHGGVFSGEMLGSQGQSMKSGLEARRIFMPAGWRLGYLSNSAPFSQGRIWDIHFFGPVSPSSRVHLGQPLMGGVRSA